VAVGYRYAGYVAAYHASRVPKHTAKTAVWAPVGAVRTVGRVLRWATVEEGNWGLRQSAAARNDAELWIKLNRQRQTSVRWPLVVLAGFAALVGLGMLAYGPVPGPARLAAVAGLVAVAARAGRPADPSTLVYWRKRIAGSERPDRVFDKVAEVIAETGVLRGRRRRCVDSTWAPPKTTPGYTPDAPPSTCAPCSPTVSPAPTAPGRPSDPPDPARHVTGGPPAPSTGAPTRAHGIPIRTRPAFSQPPPPSRQSMPGAGHPRSTDIQRPPEEWAAQPGRSRQRRDPLLGHVTVTAWVDEIGTCCVVSLRVSTRRLRAGDARHRSGASPQAQWPVDGPPTGSAAWQTGTRVGIMALTCGDAVERVTGIEPARSAWEPLLCRLSNLATCAGAKRRPAAGDRHAPTGAAGSGTQRARAPPPRASAGR
jgi:hypothetical protein